MMKVHHFLMLAVAVAASATMALAQPARPTQVKPVRPLTFAEAESLSDAELVERAFQQLASKTLHVERPSPVGLPPAMSDPSFSYISIILRPKAADWVTNLCEATRIGIHLSPVDQKAWPDLKRRLGNGPRFRIEAPPGAAPQPLRPEPDLHEPAMAADRVQQSTAFKIIGPMSESAVGDPGTRTRCAKLETLNGFFDAPSASSVRNAVWLMGQVAAGAKSKDPPFKLDCFGMESECPGILNRLSTDRLIGVGECPQFDSKVVTVPTGYACVHLSYFESGDRNGSKSYTTVSVISQTVLDAGGARANIHRVLVSGRMMVVG